MERQAPHIAGILQRARGEFIYSGYQFYGEGPRGPLTLSGGTTSYWAGAAPVGQSTYFDIGSVTKAVATTTLLALAVQENAISLSAPLSTWVPEVANTGLASLTPIDLLSHSSGLDAWLPIGMESGGDVAGWFRHHHARARTAGTGVRAVYSDLGFLLLGLVLERVWGELGESFQNRVAGPLGLREVRYGPLQGETCAATEFHLGERRLLAGVVFDDNCRYLGGCRAHAGLFATARGLAPWATEWLKAVRGESRWLSQKTARLFTTRSNRAPESTWALGWDTRSERGSSAGTGFSMSSFGHLGYPGCSVWIDPEKGHFALLFTNRVHPSRLDERIRELRPRVHDAWVAYCGG